jgi:hypothetical protein
MKFGFVAKHSEIRLVAWLCAAPGPPGRCSYCPREPSKPS